jgi:hypothetical protein
MFPQVAAPPVAARCAAVGPYEERRVIFCQVRH